MFSRETEEYFPNGCCPHGCGCQSPLSDGCQGPAEFSCLLGDAHPWLVSSKSSGSKIKIYQVQGMSKTQLHKSSLAAPRPFQPNTPAHTELSPQTPLCPPLKENKKLVPKTKTENPGRMWGRFVVATHFYMFKKKSACWNDSLLSHQRSSSGGPADAAHSSADERTRQPFQAPGAAATPSPRGLAMGLASTPAEHGDLNVTPKTKM